MNKSESKYFNTACTMDEAFLLLLEKKDFEYITVKEICSTAGVNRSTFYLHYETIGDLLEEAIEYVNRKFSSKFKAKAEDLSISNVSKDKLIFLTSDYIAPYLTFVKENKRIYKTICNKPQVFNTEKVFQKMYRELFYPIMDRFGASDDIKPYVFEFYTKGTLAIIMKWVELGCRESIEFITQLIVDCAQVNVAR